jgi:hypothetical protein
MMLRQKHPECNPYCQMEALLGKRRETVGGKHVGETVQTRMSHINWCENPRKCSSVPDFPANGLLISACLADGSWKVLVESIWWA